MKSEFKNLPSGWKVVRLGEICDFYKGKGISKDDISENGIFCIRYGELYTTYSEKIDKIYSKTNLNPSELFLSKCNDIIIPCSGETAQDIAKASCVLLDNIALGGDLNVLRTRQNGIFLSYYLNVIAKKDIAKIAQGVSIVHLYASELKNLKIKIPPLDEQEKIAEILSTWDEAINLTINLIENKKQFKKALMQNLLTAKIRFPEFKDEWKKMKMNDIFTEIDERSTASNQYEILSVTLNGIVPQNTHFKKRIASQDDTGYKILRYGNLVIGMNLWMGGLDVLTNKDIGIVSPAYRIFKIDDKCNIYFLKNFIKTKKMLKLYILHSEQGASIVRRNLNLSELLEEKIKLPNLKEQQKIAEVLTACDDEINLLNLKLENLKKQKQGLMQKLLSGKVRVKYV